MLSEILKSVIDQDRAPVVICNLNHIVVYMNRSAVNKYGKDLTGSSLLDCHSEKANKLIFEVIDWFLQSSENNMIYTYRNDSENKDVYMVALRDANKDLIGYYEKHEYRTTESAEIYDFSRSLI